MPSLLVTTVCSTYAGYNPVKSVQDYWGQVVMLKMRQTRLSPFLRALTDVAGHAPLTMSHALHCLIMKDGLDIGSCCVVQSAACDWLIG